MNKRIKHALIDSHKSQSELAKHLGISKSYMSMLIKDDRKMKFETMKRIAQYLKVDINYLLGLK